MGMGTRSIPDPWMGGAGAAPGGEPGSAILKTCSTPESVVGGENLLRVSGRTPAEIERPNHPRRDRRGWFG